MSADRVDAVEQLIAIILFDCVYPVEELMDLAAGEAVNIEVVQKHRSSKRLSTGTENNEMCGKGHVYDSDNV